MKWKFCGIRREEDVSFLNEFPPHYAGFVFAKGKRMVTAKEARRLGGLLLPEIKKVGVFVNASVDEVAKIAELANLDVIQLHGGENKEYISALIPLIGGREIWKAVRVQSQEEIRAASALPVSKLLLDSFVPGTYGGTGRRIDLKLIDGMEISKPFFLAGGLTVENLSESLSQVCPFGVDISSGLETDGFKDRNKIKKIYEMLRRMYHE